MIKPELPLKADWSFWRWLVSMLLVAASIYGLSHRQDRLEEAIAAKPSPEPLPVGELRVFPGQAISSRWGNGVAKALEDLDARCPKRAEPK